MLPHIPAELLGEHFSEVKGRQPNPNSIKSILKSSKVLLINTQSWALKEYFHFQEKDAKTGGPPTYWKATNLFSGGAEQEGTFNILD